MKCHHTNPWGLPGKDLATERLCSHFFPPCFSPPLTLTSTSMLACDGQHRAALTSNNSGHARGLCCPQRQGLGLCLFFPILITTVEGSTTVHLIPRMKKLRQGGILLINSRDGVLTPASGSRTLTGPSTTVPLRMGILGEGTFVGPSYLLSHA